MTLSANSRYSRPRANSRKAALRPGPRYFAVVFTQACLNCLLTCLTRRTQRSLWPTELCSDLDNILLHPMELNVLYMFIFIITGKFLKRLRLFNGGAVRVSLCVYIILIMLKLHSLPCRIIVTFSIVLGIFYLRYEWSCDVKRSHSRSIV